MIMMVVVEDVHIHHHRLINSYIDAQEIRVQLINFPRLYVEDSDSLMSYIMLKRRGASVGLNGSPMTILQPG